MAHLQNLSYNAFPPHRHISPAKPISAASALVHIQSYLNRAQDAAHLHPDASLNEHGPQFARHASEGGLVLQLLRRVEKGLKGERIVADLPGEDTLATSVLPGGDVDNEEELPSGDDSGFGKHYTQRKKESGLDADEQAALESGSFVGRSYNEQMIDDGEDGITDGEIGPRSNFVRDLSGASTSKKRRISQVGDSSKMSKEERKRAKKERHLEERRRQQGENERRNLAQQTGAQDKDGDVDMEEATAVSPEDEADAVDKLKPMDLVVQNGGTHTRMADGNGDAETKEDKKTKRRAQKQAKRRAQQELNGGTVKDNDDMRNETTDRSNERGKVEVVDNIGREPPFTRVDTADKKHKKTKRDKKERPRGE